MNTTTVVVGVITVLILIGGFALYSGSRVTPNSATTTGTTNTVVTTPPVPVPTPPVIKETGVMVGGSMMMPSLDIVDNASKANNLTTVITALKAAGLVNTLKGPGPFTVFAPTDTAFGKLASGTVASLLKPENKSKLVALLTYHVVPGVYMAGDLTNGMKLKTVNGQELIVTIKDGKTFINGAAMIDTPNILSSNGVSHVINMVLMPPR